MTFFAAQEKTILIQINLARKLMSKEDLERFRDRVTADQTLRVPLRAASDLESLIRLSVELGQANGYDFTSEEVRQFMAEIEEQAHRPLTYPLEMDEEIAQAASY